MSVLSTFTKWRTDRLARRKANAQNGRVSTYSGALTARESTDEHMGLKTSRQRKASQRPAIVGTGERYAIPIPGSTEPQRCDIWGGGSPWSRAVAVAVYSPIHPNESADAPFERRALKLPIGSFNFLSRTDQNRYLVEMIYRTNPSATEIRNSLENQEQRQALIEQHTLNEEQTIELFERLKATALKVGGPAILDEVEVHSGPESPPAPTNSD